MFQAKLVNIAQSGQIPNFVPYYEATGIFSLNGQASLLYNATLQAGYQHLEDIEKIYALYLEKWGDEPNRNVYVLPDKSAQKRIDWKFVRDYLRDIVESLGFNTLTTAQKIVAAKCNAGTKAQQEAILSANFTIQERQAISFNYDYNVQKARIVRASEVIGALWQFTGHLIIGGLYPVPAYILTNCIAIETPALGEIAGDLLDLFKFKGLQGIQIANDGILGIYDFILSTVGTRFETNGLGTNLAITTSGTPSGFADWDEFKDYIFDIIHKGEY